MSNPAFVGNAISAGSVSVNYTPTPGNDVIIVVLAPGGSTAVLSSLNDSIGSETVIADYAYAAPGFGAYRVHGVAGGVHNFSVTWTTAPTYYWLAVIEMSNVYGFDTTLTPANNSGSSTTPTTNPFTPTQAGDLLVGAFIINRYQSSLGTWTNGFTQLFQSVSGPTYGIGYLANVASGSPITAGVTVNPSATWNGLLLAYAGAPPPPPAPPGPPPRTFFLPPGPGRLGGKGGAAVGPFINFLVKDIHRLVSSKGSSLIPPSGAFAKSSGKASATTAIKLAASAYAKDTGRISLVTSSPLTSAASQVSKGRSVLAAAAGLISSSTARSGATASLGTTIALASSSRATSSARGVPNTHVALASSGFARQSARAAFTTHLALVSLSRQRSGASAVMLTHVALAAGGHNRSSAGGEARFSINFSSAARQKSSARSALTTHKPLASSSRAVSRGRSLIVNADQFFSASSSGNTARATLTTGIALESVSASKSSGSMFQAIVVRFGYAVTTVEPETVALPQGSEAEVTTIIAGSSCNVVAQWFDIDGDTYLPLSVSYRIDDLGSGEQVADWAALPVAQINTVTVTPVQNAMVSETRPDEYHQVLFELVDQFGESFRAIATYRLERAP